MTMTVVAGGFCCPLLALRLARSLSFGNVVESGLTGRANCRSCAGNGHRVMDSGRGLRILLIEDDPRTVALVRAGLA
ncbi:MAG TPA: hypothetical protein VF286_10340, partial [Acidiphilium sp.]